MSEKSGNSGNFYKSGDWLALCDICGFRFKASRLKKNWKNEMVCEDDFELRNAQDFIKVRPEKIGVPWARPEPADVFISVCYLWDRSAFADLGTADCMIADYVPQSYINLLLMKYGSPTGPTGSPYPYPVIPPNNVCTLIGSTSYAGYGVAGCSLPSNVTGF